jgi:hypothetical protein
MAKAKGKSTPSTPPWSTPKVAEIHEIKEGVTFAASGDIPQESLFLRRYGELFDDLKSPTGAPATYDRDAIVAAAEMIAREHGVPDRLSWFCEKVCDELQGRIKLPDNRQLERFIRSVYLRHRHKA